MVRDANDGLVTDRVVSVEEQHVALDVLDVDL